MKSSALMIIVIISLCFLGLLFIFPGKLTLNLMIIYISVLAIIVLAIVLVFVACVFLALASAALQFLGLYKPKDHTSPSEAAEIIDSFISKSDLEGYDFDWFCGTNYYVNPIVQKAANECASLPGRFPAVGDYCSEEGYEEMRRIRDYLLQCDSSDQCDKSD